MTITFTPLQILSMVFHLAVVIWLISISRTTWRLDKFVKGLVAHAKAAQIPPNPKLIKQWVDEYESPATSEPRREAYRQRLIEVGVLDEDGNAVKVEDASGD